MYPVALVAVAVGLDIVFMQAAKDAAFAKARELSQGKGIINVGCGTRFYQLMAKTIAQSSEVKANIDMYPDGVQHFIQLDVEKQSLPFLDKQFGVAFCSHVLEHLEDWRFALAEMSRVADYVIIVLPHPLSPSGLLWPEHKQHFSDSDMQQMVKVYPNLLVYY